MMNQEQKADVCRRLKKIEGQIRGIVKMIEDDRYCVDVLSQTRAISSAIRSVENLVMKQHLQTCVKHSMQSNDIDDQNEKIAEIMELFSKFRKG